MPYNNKPYLREDFRLSEKEREKLCEWFLQNKNIVRTNYGNELVNDMNMFQHSAVSLIYYYYYDWGFQNYFKLVKNFKNQKDEWITTDGFQYKKDGINRIDLFREIFNYLFKIKDKTSYDELVSNIKNSMILKQYELKQLEGSWKDYYGSSSDL